MTQIIAFEGLHPLLIPWLVPSYVERGLLEPVGKTITGPYETWRGGFMSYGPQPKVIVGDHLITRFIVIGHSMGGPSAIDWCNRNSVQIDLLLTIDPRPLHRPYIKPKNVKRAVNFYQQSWWMPGYPVEGAENVLVQGYPHTAMPGSPGVVKALMEAL